MEDLSTFHSTRIKSRDRHWRKAGFRSIVHHVGSCLWRAGQVRFLANKLNDEKLLVCQILRKSFSKLFIIFIDRFFCYFYCLAKSLKKVISAYSSYTNKLLRFLYITIKIKIARQTDVNHKCNKLSGEMSTSQVYPIFALDGLLKKISRREGEERTSA